jgi:hypothetical protein
MEVGAQNKYLPICPSWCAVFHEVLEAGCHLRTGFWSGAGHNIRVSGLRRL